MSLKTPPRERYDTVVVGSGAAGAILAYRFAESVEVGKILFLNLVYWYVPASLTPVIFRLGHRFRVDGPRWIRALGVHAFAAVSYSVIHCACLIGTRLMLWESANKLPAVAWTAFVQRQYLSQLDFTLMTYTTVLGLSYALHYSRESQARAVKEAQLETRLAEARLRTLEAELQPHFLFNTLHAISSLVHTNPDGADRMISRLSDLLRLTFDRSGAARVSLQEELEFLQKYLEIEQTRFHDRLTVKFDIDPDTLDAEVPRLILQPLVENAIKHGVSPKPGAGLVQIATRRHGREPLDRSQRQRCRAERRRARAPAQRRRALEHARSARVPLRPGPSHRVLGRHERPGCRPGVPVHSGARATR